MLVWREIESMSVFQSLMIEENVISSDTKKKTQNEQANKKKEKNEESTALGI